MRFVLLLLFAPPLAAAPTQADYQSALLREAKALVKHAPDALPKGLLDDYEKNANSFASSRVSKTYAPALAQVMPEQERALEAVLRRLQPSARIPSRPPDAWSRANLSYEYRYGGGDGMNFLEVLLDNHLNRLGAGPGATRFEPVLRFTPAVYQWNNAGVGSLIQLGLNYYFFSPRLRILNPVGLAVGLGNPTSSFPLINMFDAEGFRAGLLLNAKMINVGFFHDPAMGLIVTTSIDFQILRGFF